MAKKILILEDELGIATGIQDALEARGHTVYMANCIEVAKQYYDADIAIIDLVLWDDNSHGNGLTFARWLKEKNPNCWRTIISGHASLLEKVMPSDAHHKLEKPVDFQELAKMIDCYDVEAMRDGNKELDFIVLREEVLRINKRLDKGDVIIDKLSNAVDMLLPSVESLRSFVDNHKSNEAKILNMSVASILVGFMIVVVTIILTQIIK